MSTAETAETVLPRAQAMIDARQYAEAGQLLAQVLPAMPSSQGWCLMAVARLGEGDDTGALDAANRAVMLDPGDGRAHRLASSALGNLGNYPDSLRAALEARRLEPDNWQAQVSATLAAANAGDLKLAADAANEALRLAPEEPDARYAAGRYRSALGDYQRAEDHYKRALAAAPAHAGVLNELGRLALAGHNPVGAVRMFARAAAAAPENPAYARNVELAVIRSAAIVVYALAAVGGVVVTICDGLRLSVISTMLPLACAWAVTGCLLALAGWRLPALTRRVIAGFIRRRYVALPIAIIAVGAALAVITIPEIINVVTGTDKTHVGLPYFAPLILIVCTRVLAIAIWRGRRMR